ncbi:MAG TPA: CehA/McbA family metallohydrolase [Vicinamibacterales bacterium]|nr:CehA/McbA family metallohydrolase [Vicinamibacterales bacterium]
MSILSRPLSIGLIATVAAALVAVGPEAQGVGPPRWFRGNTHTHSLNSDGDSTPEDIARWYREHGYHFVVFTDHEFITPVDGLNAVIGAHGKFLVMSGQEVTGRFNATPVHANGLGLTTVVMPRTGTAPLDVLQKDVAAIREAGALPQINHPNFGWALTGADLSKVEGTALLEIWNGHPMVNNLGGGGVASAEAMWDEALTAGRRLFAVADDDAHHFKRLDDPEAAAPNRGWVMVRSRDLTQAAIIDAMGRGDFYASTGVTLSDVQATATQLRVVIAPTTFSKYRVQFIGAGGRLLGEVTESPAEYTFKGNEQYVRARVIESNGKMAWTQPAFLK